MVTKKQVIENINKEIELRTKQSKIILKVWEVFSKYFDDYKTNSGLSKRINKELSGIKTSYEITHFSDKIYIYEDNNPAMITIYKSSDTSLTELEQWKRGFYISMTFDYVEKLKLELENIDKIYDKYQEIMENIEEMKALSPIPKKVEHTIRDPNLHYKDMSYFLKGQFKEITEVL